MRDVGPGVGVSLEAASCWLKGGDRHLEDMIKYAEFITQLVNHING